MNCKQRRRRKERVKENRMKIEKGIRHILLINKNEKNIKFSEKIINIKWIEKSIKWRISLNEYLGRDSEKYMWTQIRK